ncbi:hypothetical protein L204_103190 [Cryptococcus depauperatus]
MRGTHIALLLLVFLSSEVLARPYEVGGLQKEFFKRQYQGHNEGESKPVSAPGSSLDLETGSLSASSSGPASSNSVPSSAESAIPISTSSSVVSKSVGSQITSMGSSEMPSSIATSNPSASSTSKAESSMTGSASVSASSIGKVSVSTSGGATVSTPGSSAGPSLSASYVTSSKPSATSDGPLIVTATNVYTTSFRSTDSAGSTTTGQAVNSVVIVVTANDGSATTPTLSQDSDAVIVTLTATNPDASTGSDGGIVIVYLTQTNSATDSLGSPTNVVETVTQHVHLTVEPGITYTAYSTAGGGSLQSASSAQLSSSQNIGTLMTIGISVLSVAVTTFHLLSLPTSMSL